MINGQIDNYTISVYTLLENNFDFGLKDYPIFDEEYRPILNKTILDWYLFHEIGYVNVNVFKHFLNLRMNLIMRNKYNSLYEAKAIKFNPLYNVEMHENFSRTVDNTNNIENNSTNNVIGTNNNTTNSTDTVVSESTNDSTNDADALALTSAYPSENMANNDLESNVYLSGGQKQTNKTINADSSTDNSTTESSSTNVGDITNNATGKVTIDNTGKEIETYSKFTEGSSAGLPFSRAMIQLKDYLDKFQLDQQVIAELSDLFINIY